MAKLKKDDYMKFTKERLAELLVENNTKAKLKKEDYLNLSRERLAELLVELDNENPVWWWNPYIVNPAPNTSPYNPWTYPYTDGGNISSLPDCCKPGGKCINPQMDCVNCPKHQPYQYDFTSCTSGMSEAEILEIKNRTEARFEEKTDGKD